MTSRVEQGLAPGALAGTRVVDFSQIAAGPYLSSLLGDLGADVIKVEPSDGDALRGMDDHFSPAGSAYFFGVNRSKRSLAIDLHSPRSIEVVDRLVGSADVLIVGMRPSALLRSGLGYERLSKINPRLIYVSITAFGESGPKANEPGIDILAQALSGVMGLTGEKDGAPIRVAPPIADISTAYLGGFAICAALLALDRDGIGQKISLNLLDSAISVLPNYVAQYLRTGVDIAPEGGAHPQIVPYQVFGTSDGYLVVACISNRFWPPLCQAIEMPELADVPGYRTNADRVHNREALVAMLTHRFATHDTAHWLGRLNDADVPCSPVNRLEDVFHDPQVLHNHIVVELEHPRVGRYRTVANPIGMSRTPPREYRYAPDLGEHSEEILRELDFTDNESAELLGNGSGAD